MKLITLPCFIEDALKQVSLFFFSDVINDILVLGKKLKKDDCTRFIKEMVTSQVIAQEIAWKCKHMSYLVVKSELPGSGIAVTLSCDLSKISWKNLFTKTDLDCLTLQAILSLGGSITMKDIKEHLSKVENENNKVWNFAIDKCTPSLNNSGLSELCQHALECKRVNFVDMMITSRKVELDPDIIIKTFDHCSHDLSTNIEILKLATKKCTPPLATEHLNILCENAVKKNRFKLVCELISQGAKLDAAIIVKECSVNVIASDHLFILELATKKCTPPLNQKDLNKLCENAVKQNKFKLVSELISQGAKLDAAIILNECSVNVLASDLFILELAIKKCTPPLNQKDIDTLCEKSIKSNKVNLVKKLLSHGAKLNEAIMVRRLSSQDVLDVVMNSPLVDINTLCKEAVKSKNGKMTAVLIEHGATLDAAVVIKAYKFQELIGNSDIFRLMIEKCNPPLDQEDLNKLCESAAKSEKLDIVLQLISHGAMLDAAILTKRIGFISSDFNVLNVAMEKCNPPLGKEALNKLCQDAAKDKKLGLVIELISRGAELNAAIIVSSFNIQEMVDFLCKCPLNSSDINMLCKEAVISKKLKMIMELIKQGATIDAVIVIKAFEIQEIIDKYDFFKLVLEKCDPPLKKENLNKLCENAAKYERLDLVKELMSINGANLDPAILLKNFAILDILHSIDANVIIEKCSPSLSIAQMNELCKCAAENRLRATVKKLISGCVELNATLIVNCFNIEDMLANKCEIFNMTRKKCSPSLSKSDLNKLCIKAIRRKKIDFVIDLMSQGAKLDACHIVDNFTPREMLDDFRLLSQAMQKCSPPLAKSAINLSFLITEFKSKDDWKNCISFLNDLLEYGISPNGIVCSGEKCPLDVVLELPGNPSDKKIELIILLLKHDAAIQHCTYPRKEHTTLLHITTKWAITSGKP